MALKPELKARSLHFLLNYVLGLPVVTEKRIRTPEIPYQVVRLWTARTRRRAEVWAEYEMRYAGMPMAKPKHNRRPTPPNELVRWFPKDGRKAA